MVELVGAWSRLGREEGFQETESRRRRLTQMAGRQVREREHILRSIPEMQTNFLLNLFMLPALVR